MPAMTHRKMFAGVIYRAKRGHVYDPRHPRYNCFTPAEYADGCDNIGDCWVLDQRGNIHPGYNVSPMPVCVAVLGEVVGTVFGTKGE